MTFYSIIIMLIDEVNTLKNLINVLYGKNDFLINEELNKLIKKHKVEDININRYDLLETNSDDVLEDLVTISFFSNNKIIIVDNFKELINMSEDILNDWVNYFKSPNPDVFLYIVLNDLISQEFLIGKTLMQYAKIIEIKDLSGSELSKYIINYLEAEKYSIENKALKELMLRTNNDLNLIMQELNKLKLYKYENKKINFNDIEKLVSRNLEENIYELTNNLLKGGTNKTIEIYYDLLVNNEDPIRIMNNVSNRIRQLIHTKLLIRKSYTQNDIMKHFNIGSGQAYYLMKDSKEISLETLEDILKSLTDLDYDIKTGRIDKQLGFEIFILGV